jgi:hypothetical protein
MYSGLSNISTLLPFLIACPIDFQNTPTQIHYVIYLGGGIRTRVQNTFCRAAYSDNAIYSDRSQEWFRGDRCFVVSTNNLFRSSEKGKNVIDRSSGNLY